MTKDQTTLGARVRLCTGGPPMVVFRAPSAENPDTAACKWFDGIKLVGEAFPIEGLVPAFTDAIEAPSPSPAP